MNRVVLLILAALAWAVDDAAAQVVQLPTFHQFSTSTTVVVPDRGGASLGGMRRGATGGSQVGAPGVGRNHTGGAAAQGGGVSVSAQIHDFAELDRRLLDRAAARQDSTPAARNRELTETSAFLSVAEIHRQKTAAADTAHAEAVALLRRADEALEAGKQGVARIYYQMAIRRSTGPLRDAALSKYRASETETNSFRNH